MTAPAVSIHRLSATARLEEERPEDAGRVARLLRRVAAERLDRALRDAPLPPGIWCVHHLDVPVRLDLERPDPALEVAWAAALVGALSRALRSGAPEVVRYDHERDALADLVCGAVTGRLGRAWAWRRLGLLDPADPPLEQAPGGAVVAVLARHPRQALGVLVTAADRVGLPALHHALGPSGWTALAGVVRRALGGGHVGRAWTAPALGGGHVGRARTAPAPDGAYGEGGGAALTAALVAGSRLAEQIRRSRVRPDPESLDALALLVAAERDASAPWRAAGGALVAAVAGMLGARGQPAPPPDRAQGAAGGPAGGAGPGGGIRPGVGERPPAPGERRPSARRGEAAARATGPPGPQPPDGPGSHPPDGLGPHQGGRVPPPGTAWPVDAPAPPDAAWPDGPDAAWPDDAGAARDQAAVAERDRRGRSTDWGGLLFLLATAADAGIPDTVLDDAVLAARPLPWILQGIALRLLPVTARDAAVAAFAATDPEEPPPWELGPPAGDDELARLELVARRWAAATAAALGEPDREPRDVVASIARRRGRVDHAPGWLEIHLDLDQVDVAVRRAGLDLDPGWVPWLGTVVRFVYG
jgi:hypothetical protein